MTFDPSISTRPTGRLRAAAWALAAGLVVGATACASSSGPGAMGPAPQRQIFPLTSYEAPSPDPRVGLAAGLMDAEEAIWNLRLVSTTPPPEDFVGVTNSDLAFTGNYAIQGNYNGFQVWDISNPASPTLVIGLRLPGLAERRLGVREPALRLG